MDESFRIPLRRRDGTVRAYAIVDRGDYERLGHLRWSLAPTGYVVRRAPGSAPRGRGQRTLYLHREVLEREYGDGALVDHVNQDRLDCRRSNLRVVTRAQNAHNQPRGRPGSSRHRGVSCYEGRWRAQAMVDGHGHYLGSFDTEDEAARVAAAFRREHMSHTVESL